jgi:hypothetical protein
VCALYFWLVLGLGMALMRSAYRPPAPRLAAETVRAPAAAA